MMKKKHVIILLVLIILVIAITYFFRSATKHTVMFQFLDGDTDSPISNHQIYICDDSVELKYIGEYPLSRFCDGEHRIILNKTTTDSSGILRLNLSQFDVRPPHNIVFDVGNSNDRWGIAKIERSDAITHRYSPSHIRIVNRERSGHVISNLIYNLNSGEMSEVFTSDSPEKIYPYNHVKLVIFR